MFTVGELFAGIGGIGLGLEATGLFEVAWQVECDKYATKVLEKRWPDALRHDDVTTFPPDDNPIWHVDLLCGGFPCQDISQAGHREGLEGERSGLFFEIVRIVERVKPRWLVLENVSALLVRGMGDVLGALAAIRNDNDEPYFKWMEYNCVPAASVGAPHRRDRVFIVAYADCHPNEQVGGGSKETESIPEVSGEAGCAGLSTGAIAEPRVLADSDSDREIGDQSEHRPRRGAIPRSEKQASLVADSNSDDRGNGNSSQSSGGKARMESRGGGSRQSIGGADTSVADSSGDRLEDAERESLTSSETRSGVRQEEEGQEVIHSDSGGLGLQGSPQEPILRQRYLQSELVRVREELGRHQWAVEPPLDRLVDGFPGRVDEIRCLGNAVVPQVAAFVGLWILSTLPPEEWNLSDEHPSEMPVL